MSDQDHLALWRKIERTDPAHVKAITGKAYKGSSPKPHFLVFKATEAFGPCGLGWGFDIVEEKLLDGALLAPGFHERIHMARVRVWYEWNGKRGQVEHVGQTVFCGKRVSGQTFTDEDAPKKSVTDALVKALSLIGFAGDIFMGRYDDSKYVANLKREIADEAAKIEAPAEIADENFARSQFIDECLKTIQSYSDGPKLRKWWQSDEHRGKCTDFDLSKDEVDHLKAALTDRLSQIGKATDTPPVAKANGHDRYEEARVQ